jgi:hypothetical protein
MEVLMRQPTPISENSILELMEFGKKKWPGFDFFSIFACLTTS